MAYAYQQDADMMNALATQMGNTATEYLNLYNILKLELKTKNFPVETREVPCDDEPYVEPPDNGNSDDPCGGSYGPSHSEYIPPEPTPPDREPWM